MRVMQQLRPQRRWHRVQRTMASVNPMLPTLRRHNSEEGRKVWLLRRFQQIRSYRDELESRNREEIPLSSGIVPRCLPVAEGP